MCPAPANMLVTLVILGCLGVQGVITSDSDGYAVAMTSDHGGHTGRQKRYPKTSIEIPRSLEMDEIKINVVPTSSKVISAPTMVRLYLPPVKPSHIHATLPLRFGRDFQPDDTHSPKSTLNLPQRFGRSQASGATIPASCRECPRVGSAPSATLPQRLGRNEFYRRYLFRAMACYSGVPEPVSNGKVGYQDYTYYDLDSEEKEAGEKTLKSATLDLLRWSF